MTRYPRKPGERLVNLKLLLTAYLVPGVITFFGCAISYFWYMDSRGFGFNGTFFAFNGQYGYYPSTDPNYPGQFIDVNSADPNEAAYASDYIFESQSVGSSLFFVSSVICQFGNALATRTRYNSIFQQNPFWGPKRNLRLIAGIIGAIGVLLILTLVPWFQNTFDDRQVPVHFAVAALGWSALILIVDECRKYIVRNYPKSWIARVAW